MSLHLIPFQSEFINVCFWYIPSRMRQMPRGPERDALLAKVKAPYHNFVKYFNLTCILILRSNKIITD